MIIAGLQKTTLIDYPGKIACIVFLAGCNFRCPWCYSRELVLPSEIVKMPRIKEEDFFSFLRERRGKLEGVVICGGEPTINKDLRQFAQKIKNLGYAIKLDTNGSNPEILKELVKSGLVNYVAMDIKVSLQGKTKYKDFLTDDAKEEHIKESVKFLKSLPKSEKFDFEFRTTAVPGVHERDDFLKIAKWIGGNNVKYYLQNFQPLKTINSEFEKIKPFEKKFLENIIKEISPFFKICELRNS